MGPKRALTPEQESAIVERYTTGGESARAIARDFPDVSRGTIYRTLERHTVMTRPELAKRRLTDDERTAVVEMCRNGKTVKATAEAFNTSPETVFRILKNNNVRLPTGRPRSCAVNDHAFDEITPESAYWIGFLFADGCVHQGQDGAPTVTLALAVVDRGHVEKFRSFLGSTHAIYISQPSPNRQIGGGTMANFSVRSHRLFQKLVEYGMVEVKSERAPIPALSNSRDFWRGAIDGDGGVGTKEGKYPTIGLAGQRKLLIHFQQFLQNRLSISLEICSGTNIPVIGTCGSTAKAIIELLYAQATVALDRKAHRAQQIVDGQIQHFPPYEKNPGPHS